MINIITRLSRKNRFLNNLLPSLQNQTFGDYHHIITYEKEEIKKHVENHVDKNKTTFCKVFPKKKIPSLMKSFYYHQTNVFDNPDEINPQIFNPEKEKFVSPNPNGCRTAFMHFPFNLYLIKAESKVKPGWVMYVDDDDKFYDDLSLETLNKKILDPDTLYFYRFLKKEVGPNEEALKHSLSHYPPALGAGFCGSSFIFHHKYLGYTAWDEWSGSDWKTCQSLWYSVKNTSLIDKIIVKITEEPGLGEVEKED